MIVTPKLCAPKIVPCIKVTTFCSFLPILERFCLVPFKTHLAVVVIVSKLVLSTWKAKSGGLAHEVDALGLIHWKSKVPIAIVHCKVIQSL